MADGLTERVARAIAPHLWAENVYVSRNYDETGTMAELIEKRRDHIRAQARAALAVVADDIDGLAGVLRLHVDVNKDPESGVWYCADCDKDILLAPGEDPLSKHQAAMLAARLRGA